MTLRRVCLKRTHATRAAERSQNVNNWYRVCDTARRRTHGIVDRNLVTGWAVFEKIKFGILLGFRSNSMIVSHKHKFIFFATPKTATHAIREALRDHLDPGDWEQQSLYRNVALPIPALRAIGHGHISVQQLRPHLPKGMWDDYFKFGFVRNPYDRFVSAYFFLTRNHRAPGQDDTAQMKALFKAERFHRMVHAVPQSHLIANRKGEIGLDFIGRYEDLQGGYDQVCSTIGVPTTALTRKNTSDHEAFGHYYDEELRRAVANFYQQDFELLGYDAGALPPNGMCEVQ